MLYVAFTHHTFYLSCDEGKSSKFKKRKKPFCSVHGFFMFFDCGMFFCIYTALREDVKEQTKREKSKSTTENLWQHSAVCHLSFMHELEWLFLPRCNGGTEELYRSVLAFRQSLYKYMHCGCRWEKDWQTGKTLICSWISTGSYLVRKKFSPPRSCGL